MLSVADIESILVTIPAGYLPVKDKLLCAHDIEFFGIYRKLGVIYDTPKEQHSEYASKVRGGEMFCNLPGCHLSFETTAGYQTHYNSVHRHICSECKKTLPTAHLLDLHISELHDSYFAARVDRGETMFSCFLEECTEKMKSALERREHCIKMHKFPSSYRFGTSHLHAAYETEGGHLPEAIQVNDKHLKTARDKTHVRATPEMPRIKAFSFGHQQEKTFKDKRPVKQEGRQKTSTVQTLENLNNLKDALSDL